MAAKIPFVRAMDFTYGEPQQVSPLIRRAVTDNGGPFTAQGTGVYIVGKSEVAVIDPGPVGNADMVLRALGGARVTHILITHGHSDHSPAAGPLAAATGAKIYANPAPTKRADPTIQLEADDDHSFHYDVALTDGQVLNGPDWTIEAIFTPGHAANHACYALREENCCFTGDHIMGWSTTVISPPDGEMAAYFASLDKIRARDFTTLWPTHGPPIREPGPFIDAYKAHRLAREEQILAQIAAGHATIREMVPVMYADVDARLHPAAAHSVLAHMIRLVGAGVLATPDGAARIDSVYRRA